MLLPRPRDCGWIPDCPQKMFTPSCSSSVSGIMVSHNTHLTPDGISLRLFPLFHFLSSCFCRGECFSHTLSPVSVLSPQENQLPALCSFSLPRFTSLCRIPAEFCGLGCADCCVNPHSSFLGVQDGLVFIWLYFMDASTLINFWTQLFQYSSGPPFLEKT